MIMHASEIAEGNYWQKVIAREAIKPLGPMDYCGLIHWGPGREEWLWGRQAGAGPQSASSRNKLMAARRPHDARRHAGLRSGMKMALGDFNQVNAAVKHMIIISDGDPSPPSFTTVNGFVPAEDQDLDGGRRGSRAGGTPDAAGHRHGDGRQVLRGQEPQGPAADLPDRGPPRRPAADQGPAERAAASGVSARDAAGIKEPLPPITGFVMTTVKENPLVEVASSRRSRRTANATILASWTYGLGRTVAFTTDAGQRWANAWTRWENYDKFFSQMIRWSMRPVNEEGKFSVATDVKDGKVRVVVTALDKDDEFLNFLNMSGVAVDPDLDDFDVKIEQSRPAATWASSRRTRRAATS